MSLEDRSDRCSVDNYNELIRLAAGSEDPHGYLQLAYCNVEDFTTYQFLGAEAVHGVDHRQLIERHVACV